MAELASNNGRTDEAPASSLATFGAVNRDVTIYFIATISMTWLFWIPYAILENGGLPDSIPGPVLEILGASGPLVVATILVALREGKRGLRTLYGRLLRFRVRWYWWLVALIVPFLVHWVPVLIADSLGLVSAQYDNFGGPFPVALLSLLPWFVLFSLEEVGWRGYALPKMQESRSALRSGILLGIGWGFWHAPLAFVPGAVPGAASVWVKIAAIFLFMIMMSLLWTWIFNNTRGSLIMANFFHVFINTSWDWLELPDDPEWLFEWILPSLIAIVIISVVAWRWGSNSLSRNGKRVTWSALVERKV